MLIACLCLCLFMCAAVLFVAALFLCVAVCALFLCVWLCGWCLCVSDVFSCVCLLCCLLAFSLLVMLYDVVGVRALLSDVVVCVVVLFAFASAFTVLCLLATVYVRGCFRVLLALYV